jgi:hypothetical protein
LRWRATIAITSALSGIAFALPSPAPRTTIQWQGAPGCIGEEELRHRVEERLGKPVFAAPGDALLVIRGEARRREDGQGWTANVTALTPSSAVLGNRTLNSGEGCRALDEPLTLVVALMIDPLAVSSGELVPAAVPVPATAPVPVPVVVRPWEFGTGVAGRVGAGVEPGVAGATELSFEAVPPGLPPLELSATLFSRNGLTAAPGASAEFSLATGGLRACPTVRGFARATLSACVGLELGEIHGRGLGFDANDSVTEPFFDLAAELRLKVRVHGGWFAQASAGPWLPLVRPRFAYVDASGVTQGVYQPAAGALLGTVGVGYAFDHNSPPARPAQ